MREQLKQIQAKAEEALSNVLQSKDLDEVILLEHVIIFFILSLTDSSFPFSSGLQTM